MDYPGDAVWKRMQEARPGAWTDYDRVIVEMLEDTCDAPTDPFQSDQNWQSRGRGQLCLLGPTAVGKSHLIESWALDGHGIEPENFLVSFPGTDDPTDLGGIPVRDGMSVTYSNPSLIPTRLLDPSMDGRWILYIDEIEKANTEVISCLLSVLHPDRRLRQTRLRPLAVVCAMNEPTRQLHPSLVSRLLVVPYADAGYDLWSRADLSVVKPFLSGLSPTLAGMYLPATSRITTPGSIHRLARWADSLGFWGLGTASEPHMMLKLVLNGSLSEPDAIAAMARYEDRPTEPSLDWARSADAPAIAAGLVFFLFAPDRVSQSHDVLTILLRRAGEDATGELSHVLDVFFKSRVGLSSLEEHQGTVAGDQDQRMTRAQEQIHKQWTKEQKARDIDG